MSSPHHSSRRRSSCIRRGCDPLDLNLGHPGCRTHAQIRLLRLGVLGVVVADRRFDSVFGQHGAVQFHGRQAQLLGNLGVLDARGLFECHASDEFGQVGGRGDGAAAAEGLELDV